jgi:hypothetical protein
MEDVDPVCLAWDEENGDQLTNDVDQFLDECGAALNKWFNEKQ